MAELRQGGGERRYARELVAAVRSRARATLVASAWLRALAIAVTVVFLLALADFLFRLPRPVRVVHWAALIVGAFELTRRVIVPALRFRPSLADVALRMERAEQATDVRGRLASGVELAVGAPASDLTGSLAARAAADADEAARGLRGVRFIHTRELTRAAVVLLMVGAIGGGIGLARPELAGIGLSRAFWPFAKVDWPKRTAVADATTTDVHPIGEALPLRALLTRTSQGLGRTDVAAAYRIITPEGTGPLQRVMLTSQDRLEEFGGLRGEVFERLIEPDLGTAESGEIEYWFQTDDDRTESRTIRLTARPRVEAVTAAVRPPDYAASLSGTFVRGEALAVVPDGQGAASIGPILAGSEVEVSLRLNKPAERAGDGAGWSQDDSMTLRFETIAGERTRTDVELLDEAGLESAEPLAIVLEVVEDAPPGVTVIEPAYDESALATAVIDVAAEGRDDLGMRWLTIEQQVARRPASSEGAPPEPLADPQELARSDAPPGSGPPELRASVRLDLSVLGARAGDEVWLSARGRDAFAAPAEGAPDERAVRSAVRRVRIIDEAAFVEQVRGELAGVRKAAIEIDGEQKALRETRPEAFEPSAAAARQGAVTERLDAQQGTIERLSARLDRNGLGDDTLSGLLRDAAGLVREATEASAEASRAIEDLPEDAQAPGERAEEAQDRVRENLEDLISMLDQGQDSWVARRTIESLLADQRALEADTAALGERTMGKAVEQLAPEELTELERIAARQRDAAERARQALESLSDRADLLEKVDPGQAQAMSQAAQRGRQERIAEQMRQAAAQVGENQTRAAAQGQQAAAEALEQMLEDIDSAESSRDQALRRVLASVIESLESLIGEQESQILALTGANAESELPALAERMVGLAGNTLGLLDEISPQRDLAPVAAILSRAVEAQERAAGSLRSSSAESAAEAEDESLARLREAKTEAERINDAAGNRESARKRAELRRAYHELLEQQVTIADETAAFAGAEPDRRTRARVRAIGQRQEGLSESLADLRRSTQELEDAAIFEFAHRRMDAASAGAAERLLAGEADAGVQRRQATVVRLLRSLIDAMAEQPPAQQFRDQQASGGGGAGGGGEPPVIPDLAELKLLRAMQAEAMEWTRNVDEAPTSPAEGELAELAELQHELAERGRALVEKLTRQPAGTPGETPAEEQPR